MDQSIQCLKNSLYHIVVFLFSLGLGAQTFSTTTTSDLEADNISNAIDQNLSTFASVRASSGIALGFGAYSGHLELEFPGTLSQNTQAFVKLDTEDSLLPSLLGGSLGGLLADVLGDVLVGNQEFTITLKNGATNVYEESSSDASPFATDQLRVVTDVSGDYYLALAPTVDFNRVRLTNHIGSLLGLNNIRNLDIYGAYHGPDLNLCGTPNYTSYDGSGITLDLLGLGGAGVVDPNLTIDGDLGTASQVGLGILGVAASIEQTVYFDSVSTVGDSFYVRLSIDPSLLTLGVADNIQIIVQNGSNSPTFSGNLSSLLDLDLLGLLEGGQPATVQIDPAGQGNRVTVRLSSLLNVDIEQSLDLFEIYRAPSTPTLDVNSQDVSICFGESVGLIANTQVGNELRWYDAELGGSLLATVNSGDPFVTPNLTVGTTYYVAAAVPGCPEESPRVEVGVNVVDIPIASDINVTGDESPICSSNDVVLTPTSFIDGTFSWYFDANATSEITDDLVVGSVTYDIDPIDGSLTISGLDQAGSPYNYFVRITEATAGCENAPGNLHAVSVNVVNSGSNIAINSSPIITLDVLASIFQIDPTFTVSGNVTGDASPGDPISLVVNGQTYNGTLNGSLGFDINVDGTDLALDANGIIDVFIDGGLCTLTGEIIIDLPTLVIDDLVQNFCRSDDPTILDLVVTGNNIVFFNSLETLVSLDLNTPLVDGETYFAGILDVPISILPRVGITVNLDDPPPPTTSETTQSFCESDNPTISDIQVNGTNVVFYDSATGGEELDASTILVDNNVYYAANRETNGCESERLAITTRVIEGESISISGEATEACLSQDYTYITQAGKQNYSWTVFGGTIVNGGTAVDDFVTVSWGSLQNATLSVLYEDPSSCSSTQPFLLNVNTSDCGGVLADGFCLFVYNEFSPNNDGYNDFFEVECIEDYTNTVQVYSRNGNMVFQSANYQNNWDGIANVNGVLNKGEHLPSGTYFYVIIVPELSLNLSGWLQLAR
ncbi:MAG: T9SS type B sorting domain-containing protein [Algicola sp.]|nr:T9SS type B sorting domain-containing protein [Algicola sp.]